MSNWCEDWFGLVYWGLTPQQQPGSYQGGDDDDEMSVSLVEVKMETSPNQHVRVMDGPGVSPKVNTAENGNQSKSACPCHGRALT